VVGVELMDCVGDDPEIGGGFGEGFAVFTVEDFAEAAGDCGGV